MVADAAGELTDVPFDPDLAVADAQRLPFADGTFDALLALHMLYHPPDLDAARRSTVALPSGTQASRTTRPSSSATKTAPSTGATAVTPASKSTSHRSFPSWS